MAFYDGVWPKDTLEYLTKMVWGVKNEVQVRTEKNLESSIEMIDLYTKRGRWYMSAARGE